MITKLQANGKGNLPLRSTTFLVIVFDHTIPECSITSLIGASVQSGLSVEDTVCKYLQKQTYTCSNNYTMQDYVCWLCANVSGLTDKLIMHCM